MIDSINVLAEQLLLFSINYFIHSTVLIGLVLLAVRMQWLAFDRIGEWVMKSAMVLGLLTALVQTNGWIPQSHAPWSAWQVQWTPVVPQSELLDELSSNAMPLPPEVGPIQLQKTGDKTSMTAPFKPDAQIQTMHSEGDKDSPKYKTGSTNATWAWLLLWSLGMAALCYRLSKAHRQWQRLMNQRQAVTAPAILTVFNRLLQRSGLPAGIKLSQSSWLTSPIAMRNEVVCPTAFLQSHRSDQIEAALAHELAHIKRRDGLWLLIAQWLQVLLFFQPLNRMLQQHIHQATEQKADSMATAWTANPRALAVTLVDVAKAQQPQNKSQPQYQMVLAMTSKKSKLLQRVENILQPKQSKTSRLWTLGLVGALSLILVTAPGVVAQTSATYQASKSSYKNISTDGGVTEISISSRNEDRKLKVKAKLKGDIEFNADETQIVSFPKNSRFDLTHTADGTKQRILIKSAPGANVENAEYTYWYEGDERAFDAQARQWLAEVMPLVWRETGLQAEARVERIRESRGDEGVLNEVALIESDFVRKTYFSHLFKIAKLDDADLERAMSLAADIGSDFELSHVLSTMVRTQELDSEALWLDYFASSNSIGSDFEMAKTMLNVLPQLPSSEAINQAYFVAAESIGSDFEMAKVLIAYLERKADETVNVQNLFAMAKDIGSDFELAKVMMAANQHIDQSNASDEVFSAYLDLATHIGSDFEMKKVYADLLKHDLQERHLERMIEAAAEHIGSDFELASLLLSITEKQRVNDSIKARIKAAARSIGSQYERNRVLAAIS